MKKLTVTMMSALTIMCADSVSGMSCFMKSGESSHKYSNLI